MAKHIPRHEFAEQWNCVCVIINDDDMDDTEAFIEEAIENEATYFDGEDTLLCVRFPGRPQELYTERALERSFEQRKLKPAGKP